MSAEDQRPRLRILLAAALVAGTLAALPSPAHAADPLIAAVGDQSCQSLPVNAETCQQQAVSDLLLGRPLSAFLALGDTQYENGTLATFQQFYEPSYGRIKPVTRPVIGNHEYRDIDGRGYFQYFGAAAGAPQTGYYSFDIGNWHLIALNSNCRRVGGCGPGTPQEIWLRNDLASNPRSCTLAYWHHPHFSSGFIGDDDGGSNPTWPFWEVLYDAGADVVLGGHDHHYERFAPQDPDGEPDPAYGIREFVVGTGGKSHGPLRVLSFNSQVRDIATYGVLEMTLRKDSYDWSFVPAQGKTFTDSGTERCHGSPRNPLLKVSRYGTRLSSKGSLKVIARCEATCKAIAQVAVTIRKRKIRSRRLSVTLHSQRSSTVRIKFARRDSRVIRRAFRRHKRLRAEVTVRASDANSKTARASVRLRLRR